MPIAIFNVTALLFIRGRPLALAGLFAALGMFACFVYSTKSTYYELKWLPFGAKSRKIGQGTFSANGAAVSKEFRKISSARCETTNLNVSRSTGLY